MNCSEKDGVRFHAEHWVRSRATAKMNMKRCTILPTFHYMSELRESNSHSLKEYSTPLGESQWVCLPFSLCQGWCLGGQGGDHCGHRVGAVDTVGQWCYTVWTRPARWRWGAWCSAL